MFKKNIHPQLYRLIPDFKIGFISYKGIEVSNSPSMLKGRLAFFQEKILMDLEEHSITDYDGVKEWREVSKALGIDPGRYRLSHEALLRRIQKRNRIPSIHSAVDLSHFFSLEYGIPVGIYDMDKIKGNIVVRLGCESDQYTGLNGRVNSMVAKLVSADNMGAFGSPIVDSERTKVEQTTKNAIHILYLKPSMSTREANKLIQAAADMFSHIHGGVAYPELIHNHT